MLGALTPACRWPGTLRVRGGLGPAVQACSRGFDERLGGNVGQHLRAHRTGGPRASPSPLRWAAAVGARRLATRERSVSALSHHRRRAARQRGLSLLEFMLGITVGLLVVAGASVLMVGQQAENRHLITEAQVQQDLRALTDIVVRELRRAGMNNRVEPSIWDPSGTGEATPNRFSGDPTLSPPSGGSDSRLSFAYRETGLELTGSLGFRLNTANGTVESLLRSGAWQEMTDRNTLEVTAFRITRFNDIRRLVPCRNPCPADAGTDCWPRVGVRTLQLAIAARSRTHPTVIRRHQATVRLRNDDLPFDDPVAPRLCPA